MAQDVSWQRADALLADVREEQQREGLYAVRDLARHVGLRRRAAGALAEFVERAEAQPPVRREALVLLRQWVPARVRKARRRLLMTEGLFLVLHGTQAMAVTTAAGVGYQAAAPVRAAAVAAAVILLVLLGVCNVAVLRSGARLDATDRWRRRRHRELWAMGMVITAMIGVSAGQGWSALGVMASAGTFALCVAVLRARLGSALTWCRGTSPGTERQP